MIVKQNIALVKPPRDAKSIQFPFHFPGVDHSRLGKGSKSHHNRDLFDGIIDHLVPVEDLDGISPGLARHSHSNDLVTGLEEFGLL